MTAISRDEQSFTWKDIYAYCRLYALQQSKSLKHPPNVLFVPVPQQTRYEFYGLDWIEKEHYDERIELVTKRTAEFFVGGTVLNKGTLHTLKMLSSAQDEEELAAIWIYAFLFDIAGRASRGGYSRLAWQIENEACAFLSERFYMWHHAMRSLVPEVYIPYGLLREAEFRSFKPLVDMALLNAQIVSNEFVPVLYSSLPEGETPFNVSSSLRRDDAGTGK